MHILTEFLEKNATGSINVPPGCPFLSGRCFAFFKHTQIIYARYVKVAPGTPQTGRAKLTISLVPGSLHFHWVKGKNPLSWVSLGLLQRSFSCDLN